MHVVADPSDADTLWVADYALWKSIDAGKTFVEVATPHGDNHDLWIDPADSRRLIEGNDGGGCISFNGGGGWGPTVHQPTPQVLHPLARGQQSEPRHVVPPEEPG